MSLAGTALLKRQLMLALCLFGLAGLHSAYAAKVGGVELDETVSANGVELVFSGAGIRKKLFFKLYVGSLYVVEARKGSDAESIVQADEAMMIQLNILSDLLTRDKMIKALNDGFKKSTGGNTTSIQPDIDMMINALSQPIRPGDRYQLLYSPGTGTSVKSDEDILATVPGLPFKQALFGIWFSDNPVQASLKGKMLGF